jgi:hypothetical protein
VVAAEGLLGLVLDVGSWQPGSFEVSRSCRSSSPAGAIMAPTFIAAGLATSRTDLRPLSRCFGAGIAGVLPTYVASTIISPFGYSPGTFAGILGFLGIYAVVVIAAQASSARSPTPSRSAARRVRSSWLLRLSWWRGSCM